MKTREKTELKTEFSIGGELDSVLDIVQESILSNNFTLEPFRFSDYASTKKVFFVSHVDPKSQRKYCCGTIELVKQKHNEVLIRLDSSKGVTNQYALPNDIPLERVFYVILQQFIQRGLYQIKD